MKNVKRKIILIFILCSFLYCFEQDSIWIKIDDGLFIGNFTANHKSIVSDSKITIVKIDPEIYSLQLLCAKEYEGISLTAKEWCEKFGLMATVNAGMFQADYLSNVGYMKNFKHVNNSSIRTDYYSVSAFNPINQDIPEFRMYDIDNVDMKTIINNYNTVIQNLRLIKRPGENRWSQQAKIWSEVALGEDRDGNVLFIFCRSPYSMHDLNNILIELPIDIVCAQHLEGGPEVSLYLSWNGFNIDKFGSYETSFNEQDKNNHAWSIPNVIGLQKKY